VIDLTASDVMAMGGYWLGAFALGWCTGRIFRAFHQLAEKLQ
jgi:hypothetical protein